MRYVSVLIVLLSLLGSSVPVAAQSYAIQGADQHFRIESQTGAGRRGPVVYGYVYSGVGYTVDRVRLAVDSIDANGQVTGTTLGNVVGTVPPNNRAYFEVPVQATGAHRVRVLSYEPVGRGV
jgi:hypothetical protein